MVELSTIARPYAEAAFDVAKTSNLNQWSDWLQSWSAVASNEDIKLLVSNPKLTDEQVLKVFVELTKTPAEAQAMNFLGALVENGRLLALPEIARQFEELKNSHEGSADAIIASAFPMTDAEVQNVRGALEKKFGSKLNVTVQVDESLIGGVCVTVGDQILDSSVRGKLNAMKAALTA
ncbi:MULTISPECIES: F0F1 ATP synthase subunit delta [unclassified Limnobacter]|jgi:F-type H+-transporting ATPase subunit delta|uniref:F0F1 ATP synthase subunit delta n=1 Tax=unclassified Limnobacter TaxID=2630203 RepID=UPI000156C4E0|nr:MULTISPECIES: F0F1 ATP synthase subunit delta [unclassified Limnobacter]EDM84730.1 ATP synthase F1, delta subunit [Limnobacter sp. MED105]MAZ09389.1 F0F1 ATP synthase subunit delta [Sutterellaceae bacterium]|tara:strand:+ start:254 stop:787 length:534 start_codon:yes stop_codon:yes gene_type:complete